MFKQFRRRLKKPIQQPPETSCKSSPSVQESNNTYPTEKQEQVEKQEKLTDAEYEKLFLELLAGVNDGWTKRNVNSFLMVKHIVEADLVLWLRAFGERLFASGVLNDDLALGIVRLGKLGIGQIGEVALDIGMRLRSNNANYIDTEDKTAVEITLNDYEAWKEQGNTLANLGIFEAAITSYDKAIEIKPDYYEAWNDRGIALYKLGRFEEAVTSFTKAYNKTIEIKPDFHETWNSQGIDLYNLGRFEEAITSYNKAIEIKPNFHLAWNNRGVALADLERFEEAITDYDKTIEIEPDFYLAWDNRGIALCNLGRFEEAITDHDKAIKIKPDFHKAWYGRGIALHYLERLEEAITSFDKAIEIKPDDHLVWNDRGIDLYNLRRLGEAITSFDKAIEIKPDYYEALHGRGATLHSLGKFKEAITDYDKAIGIKPDYHQVWNDRGNALLNLGRFEEAITSLDQAIKTKNDDHETWKDRGNALFSLGRFEEAITSFDQAIEIKSDKHEAWNDRGAALADLGRLKDAITSYNKAIEIEPDSHEAWNNLGNALLNLGRFEEAITSFNKAIEIKPDKHEAWNDRGTALLDLVRLEEAIASYDKAIEIKPDYYEAWNNRGYALRNLGRFEEAITNYDKAIEIKPDFYLAWGNRGYVLYNIGRLEEAITSYDKTIEIKPDFYEAWNNRGTALLDLGRFEEAITSYDKTVEIKPNFYEAWNNRGTALLNLGRFEEAITSYDKAIEIKPDFYEVWNDRGIAAGNSVSCYHFLASLSPITRLNPKLNLRGYEGKLASYQEGLKYCPKETHLEGYGKLNQAIGNAHYHRGNQDNNPRLYWYKAVKSYNEALTTLTQEDFPEAHLEVLRGLIRVRLDLRDIAKAEELQRIATDLLRRLIEDCKSPAEKQNLALKFAGLQQLTVDLAVQSGNLVKALEVAEQGKNTCLSWLFDGSSDDIDSPTWADIKQLLNPTTVIVYWHLSPAALHTFILKHDSSSPIILRETQLEGNNEFISQAQRLYKFEDWVKEWNEQYANYYKCKNEPNEPTEEVSDWRNNLPNMLRELKNILNIPEITKEILSQTPQIQNLILVPHRDLHRFPLHVLFPDDFTLTYLPSAKIGILKKQVNKSIRSSLLSIEAPNSMGDNGKLFEQLLHAEIESATICQMFKNPQRISRNKATKDSVIAALKAGHNTFHFTGHGTHDFNCPKNSALALSGTDRLKVEDILQLTLNSYSMISLCACETAVTGNQTIDTEYVGLVSAFLRQGAANVLSTLWRVESISSAVFMIEFYRLWHEGITPSNAKKQVQKWLRNITWRDLANWYKQRTEEIKDYDSITAEDLQDEAENIMSNKANLEIRPFTNPYYWASFIIAGNTKFC